MSTDASGSSAQRRRCILEAANRLLRHYGPQKTTVADVAREAGVGVGTVYLEFPSKDVIIEELSRARHEEVLLAMRRAAVAEGRTSAEQLSGAFDARLDAFLSIANEGAHACDLVHCSGAGAQGGGVSRSPVQNAQATFFEAELGLVADVLHRGHAAGELDCPDIDGTAQTVLRAYASFALPWLRGKDPAEVRRAIAAMHGLVLHGLLRRTGKPSRARR